MLFAAARLYTDLLWYAEVHQVAVLWTTLKWKLLAVAGPGLGTACFVLLNLAAVERAAARADAPPRDRGVAGLLWRQRWLVKPALAVACGALVVALRSADSWELLALWTRRSAFGVEDPLFHRDIGYFVFSLPLYEQVARWLLATVLLAGTATLAAYAAAGTLRSGRTGAVPRAARTHILLLAAAGLVVVAWRLRLEQFSLALPHDPTAPGATYTDVTVRLPALRLLSAFALVGACVCVYACVRRVSTGAALVLGSIAVLALAGNTGLPDAVQRFSVQPQQLARERPHLEHAIAFTRRAYGLDRVGARVLDPSSKLTRSGVAEHRDTVANVPLWDPSVLEPAMNELQSMGTYYGFPSVTVDRYSVDGEPRLMTVGARQLALSGLAPGDRGWGSERFAYTHGYGVVAMHGGDADRSGYPRFAQQGFDSRANPLRLRQPRVYFGEQAGADPPYVVLNTRSAEVDAPSSGDRRPTYHYDGGGGIAISGPLRRLAFAARFGDLDLLLTQIVTDRSRIVLHRNAADRVRTVAPFLQWDAQPQTAVIDGRVQFLLEGYTTSASYPYSAESRLGARTVNYVRLAARAAVDAFTGRVSIYEADTTDPIVRAWRAVYPGLFLPSAQMPADMRAHLHYPARLFEAQAAVYATYHAEDPTAFWNGSDAWAPARQLAGPVEQAGEIHFPEPEERVDADERDDQKLTPSAWRMEPAHGLARLPGDAEERVVLAAPFTPQGRENLVAYLAGSVDARGRPRLESLSLPRDRLPLGPTQATRRILSSPGVVRRLALLNRESRDLGKAAVSRTILGVTQVVPIAGALVHVQAVYLSAGGEGVPRLRLVTAYADGRVGYGRSLAAALRHLLRS